MRKISFKKNKTRSNPLTLHCPEKLPLLFLLLFPISGLFAQEEFSVFYEPEISAEVNTGTKWSYDFVLSNREAVYVDEDYRFHALFIDFSHFTNYKIGQHGKASLGVKVRTAEIFDELAHDEIRLTQQYAFKREHAIIETAHRFRFEERFRKNTSYRARYRFSVQFPLGGEKTKAKEFALELKTEALLSLKKGASPEIDQRFGADLEYEFLSDTEISIGVEYQYDDYFHDPQSELFFFTGIEVEL